MSASFTPGPWHVVTNGLTEHVIVATQTDDTIVVLDDNESPHDYDAYTANARLIAAAPALYEALEHILAGSLSLPRFAEDEARAALKLARGEEA